MRIGFDDSYTLACVARVATADVSITEMLISYFSFNKLARSLFGITNISVVNDICGPRASYTHYYIYK